MPRPPRPASRPPRPLSLALLALTAIAAACDPAVPRRVVAQPNVPPHRREVGDYAPRIDSPAAWQALAATPGRQMVARTEVVKVIIDLADNWRPYFLQSQRWEIHYYFANRFLARPGLPIEDHTAFNIREYRRADRRFVLGTLVRYRDQDVWAFELIAGDTLDIPRTVRAFETVKRHVFFGSALRYHPVPAAHDNAQADAELRAARVPLVTTQQLYGALRYQPLNPGEAYGYLRFVQGEPDPSRIRRTDIVVTDGVPLDLPVCAAIITSELQTPLAHVSVLAANRGTPNMALRGASTDATLRALEGRLVRLHVSPQEWRVEPATQQQAERAWETVRPRNAFRPPMELRDTGLPDVRALALADVNTAGAKAAQLGELSRVTPPIELPRGFVLPFYAYHDHLARNGLDRELAAMMAAQDFQSDPQVREARLRAFRERVARAPIRPALVAGVRARINQLFPRTRVRFRSSTNAEDLPGFNGAGLYRSVVVPATLTDAEIADAIRTVWSSVWSFQGFEERAYFRIEQGQVAMAILVQESIDDDVVDGVAITGNPFNEGRPALFINVQTAGGEGGAVTSARGDEVPEQIMYYTYGEEREYERLSRSSRTGGAPVLTDAEIYQLSLQLRAIHRHFVPDAGDRQRAMDVEFILAGPRRRIVFVQARPYTLRYDEGRGWALPP